MPPLAQDILAEVELISTDDSDEDEVEDHLPIGFLEGPFILGPPTTLTYTCTPWITALADPFAQLKFPT